MPKHKRSSDSDSSTDEEKKRKADKSEKKRAGDDDHKSSSSSSSSDSEEEIGPMPAPGFSSEKVEEEKASLAAQKKRRRVLPLEDVYLSNLPCAEYYEKSYMHRDVIAFVVVSKTDFIITASVDGHVKFWKKMEQGIEFVKHFRSHLGNIQDVAVNAMGSLFCTISNDQSIKIYDVVNFDMINMIKLDYVPQTCEWIHSSSSSGHDGAVATLAVAPTAVPMIHIYSAHQEGSTPLKTLDNIHRTHPVLVLKYNPVFETVLSVDSKGMIEYWTGSKYDFEFPKNVQFDSKLDTDLFLFVKDNVNVLSLTISPNGRLFAAAGANRKIYVFKFLTGKLMRIFDESLQSITEFQQKSQFIPPMEFGRRMAVERELEKTQDSLKYISMVFDETSNFLLYPTVVGVKVVNLVTNKLIQLIGKPENLRILNLAMFQGKPKKLTQAAPTVELEAAENPTIDSVQSDPTLFCTAFKKNRFFMFTRRDANDHSSVKELDRDVFNEKPSKEDIIAATDATVGQKIYDTAVMHTTKGDIQVKLFGKECPKTVENFCVHAKNGYYNGHIFHRVIKGFMIQTGDPTGIGTGGESIWGGEFEDEFHPSLKHDRPYTLSMANAGPNTNGSQFFITVIPTPWLDNKHTVFGRIVRGMETVQNISMVKTNQKTDKPYDDVSVINISLK
ncbi:Peptidylprolyl isomerase domain and WD repeat-containing protein 1 [Orchesella cincta]|uniref:peptidylprolyl isomerase n=1 Tax=Orchesella cincta TaxID=48709 RepID=A0A1D2M9B7_ORCCI|nr:Peptidylprolyl isomerase domain and WD repeat-containing protein 1 [Orchesella cincta]